jgi:hypothetical protein
MLLLDDLLIDSQFFIEQEPFLMLSLAINNFFKHLTILFIVFNRLYLILIFRYFFVDFFKMLKSAIQIIFIILAIRFEALVRIPDFKEESGATSRIFA